MLVSAFFFFSSRRRHTRLQGDWSSDVCSSDLDQLQAHPVMFQCLVVAQEQGRPVDLRQHHVEIAIAINISERGAASYDRLEEILARLRAADGNEGCATRRAGVPKELRGLGVTLALLNLADRLFEVAVGCQQIEPPIEIVIKKENPEF